MKKKNILNKYPSFIFSCALALFLLPSLLLSPFTSFAADDSLCARVKIEIRQEVTLERQAFDAHMRINNGLTHITLENVEVEVNFSDEEGNSEWNWGRVHISHYAVLAMRMRQPGIFQ